MDRKFPGDRRGSGFLHGINFKDFGVAQRVAEGVSTDVYRLERGGIVYYLRILSKGKLASTEVEVHKKLLEHGVHAPVVEAYEDNNPELGASYMIVKEIGGTSVESQTGEILDEDFDKVLFSAGQDLAKVNSIPVKGFGRMVKANQSELAASYKSYDEYMLENFAEMINELRAGGILDAQMADSIKGKILQNRKLLQYEEAVLAHADLDLSHIFSDGGEYKGMIDFSGMSGTGPYHDLAYFRFRCGQEASQKLVKGYQTVRPLAEDYEARIQLEGLIIAVKKLHWSFAKGKGKDSPRFEKAKIMLEGYLQEMTI